jgi:hypothetical protein
MENTLNKSSLAKATRLLEVLYLPESRILIKIMESYESINGIDLLIRTGWQEDFLYRQLELLHQVGAVKLNYEGKGKNSYQLNHEKILIVCKTAKVLSKSVVRNLVP